jgi:hypothetical protein
MLPRYAPINELYPTSDYQKEISSLDEKVEKLDREKKIIVEKNAILSATIKGQQEENSQLFTKFQQAINSVRESGYTIKVNGDGIIKAEGPEGKIRNIQPFTNEKSIALKDIIDAEKAIRSKNESIIFGINQSINPLIREIASYSHIFEVYKGNPQRMTPVLWVAFLQDINYTRGDLATVPITNTTLSELAGAYMAYGNFSSIIPKSGYPTYLVVNPSTTAGANICMFKMFREETESLIREEYSKQGLRNKFFRQPFLWDMEKRIGYFKEQNAPKKEN